MTQVATELPQAAKGMPAESERAEPGDGQVNASSYRALASLAVLVCTVALLAVAPLWVPLVLAAWSAIIAAPLHRAVARWLHRRKSAAGLLTVLLVVAFLAPIVVAVLSLSFAAIDLVQRLLASQSSGDALRSLTTGGGTETFDLQQLSLQNVMDLAQRHGTSAMSAARTLFGAATVATVALVVFVCAFYTFLVEGKRLYDWLLLHSPLERGHFHRLGSVFAEVGRGLVVGVGLTALAQGVVATIGYIVCGVPQALVLGVVTIFAALIPSIGSALVWVPVAGGLFLSGRHGAAIAMVVIGCVVSVVDNAMRPLMAKYGKLRLHGLLLFVSMLGGIAAFGGGGLLLGPLFVRLGVEVLAMLRESRPTAFPAES